MDGMIVIVIFEFGEENIIFDGGILCELVFELVKNLVDVQLFGDEQFVVIYEVVVINIGGVIQYDLIDILGFDDDIVIIGVLYIIDVVGNVGGVLVGSGFWILVDDQFIIIFGEDIYMIIVNVICDFVVGLIDGGDNEYILCVVLGDGLGSVFG